MEINQDFWEKWYKADELKKLALTRKLPIPKEYCTLVNSYFIDLARYVESMYAPDYG